MNWVKKLVLSAGLTVFWGATAFGAAQWIGNAAICINGGDWYYNDNALSWCKKGAFAGATLGTVGTDSFTIGGQIQLYDEAGANWGQGTAYLFYSIDGGTAVRTPLTYYKFENSNNFFQSGGNAFAPVTVSLAGLSSATSHTLAVYFKDVDGRKTTATVTATFEVGAVVPDPGNVWHVPGNLETWGRPMRDPLDPDDGSAPFLRLGNQSDVQDGWMTAANIKYRIGTSGAWSSIPMGWEEGAGGEGSQNAYWSNALPAVVEGQTVQYYFEAEFGNSASLGTTYVFDNGADGCDKDIDEAEAQASPFQFTVGAAPVPDPGNVWHVPANLETWGRPMRDPLEPGDGAAPFLRLGNQSDVQDDWMTAANIKYRVGTSGAWSSIPMGWEEGAGGEGSQNAYWSNALPAVVEGQTVQYYFEALFGNSASLGTTYVFDDGADGCDKGVEEAEAQASPFEFTVGAHVYNLGNAWHVPGQYEPWPKATMRNPCYPSAGEAICFFVGNQAYGDGGNPGDMSGGTLYHRASGASAWSSVALEHEIDSENNKYWKAILPAGTYASAGDMEYYVEVTYNDHDTTYLGTDSGARSQTFATAAEAQQHLFTCPIGDTAGQEPGYMWHAGNAVVAGTNAVQFWVKIGYTKDGTDWADTVQLRYNFKPVGTNGVPKDAVRTGRTAKKRMVRALSSYSTANFVRDHEEEDSSEHGNAVWWSCTLTDDNFMDSEQYLEYEIVAKNSQGNDTWRWADYRTGSATNQFYYTMFQPGSGALTVNGLNADYTTSKFFIDEAAGETVTLEVVYSPQAGSPYAVEIFSNVGRRDYWNADIDDNHIADSIFPPSGDLITSNTVGSYFAAIPMERESPTGPYKKTLTVGKTGAYRLTARYKETAGDSWHYYSDNGIRDHAIVISPKKVLQQRVYEINGMTAKASSPTEAGHSTFADLIEGEDSFAEFGIPYLNKIQANCLWFQPIHTSSEQGLMVGGEPGSPYAAKDYFSVSKWYGKEVNGQRTTAQALMEFTNFVAACDAGKSPSMSQSYVGTINIMLDGVFNHTSWDAVFGVMGETMGIVPAGQGANTPIASVMPGWYANCSDYGAPATWYNGPGWGNHDIACGPDRGDFGKWEDTAELFYGSYSALVRHNPDNNGDYLNENDIYRYDEMDTNTTVKLWEYMGSYVPYWLEKTGHAFGNEHMGERDANGVALDDYGIDGLRCDFGQGLPPQFWEYCINRARAKKWNFMFMAESLDGGKVSYRSNRHFDILNESFVFAARNAGNPSELLAVTDDKKAAYNGGAVLLNLTSHDEVMPYSDPWKTASRYAMLATVKGLPMTMYGQEQGIVPLTGVTGDHKEGSIVETNAPWTGFAKFELNFGKWVADFKTWNKLTIWDDPPMGADASHGMAQLYGHVNWARASSPALQSDVQWMLDKTEGYRSTDIWAMAKAEEYGALANGKDAVLAFVLFVNDPPHYATAQTFSIPAGAAAMLGLEAGESYTARNLASGNAEQILWTNTTEQLTSEGVWVDFPADQNGSAFYNDGAMVQFLKLEKYVPPATHDITVTVGANGSVSPNGTVTVEDGENQEFTITADPGYRIESVLADGVPVAEFGNDDTTYPYTWENVTADGTLEVAFTQQVWTITVSAGSNGSVSPNGPVSVPSGSSLEVVVTADAGYRIESVLVDLTPVRTFENTDTTYTYTWSNVTADGTLSATFVEQTVAPTVVPSESGVDVPVAWMEAFYPEMTYEQWETQVNEPGANGYTVWQSYVADLDPTDPASQFAIDTSTVEPSAGDNGQTELTLAVKAGRTYTAMYSSTPLAEITTNSWIIIDTYVATEDGTHTFTHTLSAADASANALFYRVKVSLTE